MTPRNLSYAAHQRHALALVHDLTRQREEVARMLDDAVCHAWKVQCALSDIGFAGAYEGDKRHSAAVWAMRARDRALARARVRNAAEVH